MLSLAGNQCGRSIRIADLIRLPVDRNTLWQFQVNDEPGFIALQILVANPQALSDNATGTITTKQVTTANISFSPSIFTQVNADGAFCLHKTLNRPAESDFYVWMLLNAFTQMRFQQWLVKEKVVCPAIMTRYIAQVLMKQLPVTPVGKTQTVTFLGYFKQFIAKPNLLKNAHHLAVKVHCTRNIKDLFAGFDD